MINPWRVLGVHRKSDDKEIRDRYLTLAKAHHPDAGGTHSAAFIAVGEAHTMLRSVPSRRAWIAYYSRISGACAACNGRGVQTKSRGITVRLYTACPACSGAGFNIKEGEIQNV